MDYLEQLIRKSAEPYKFFNGERESMRAGLYSELHVASYMSIVAGVVVLDNLIVKGVNNFVQVFMPPNGVWHSDSTPDTQVDVTLVSWEELAVYLRLM